MDDSFNPYAAPEADSFETPATPWAGNISPALRLTRRGLTCVYFGILTMLLSAIVMVFGGVVARAMGGGGVFGLFTLLMGACGFGMLVGVLLAVIGPLLCLTVPAETGAKGFVVGSVVFHLVSILLVFGQWWTVMTDRFFAQSALQVVSNISGLIGAVLFVLFTKKLSEYLGRDDLAARARNVLIGIAVLVGLSVVMFVALVALGPALVFIGLAVVVGALILFVMYANLINGLRKALAEPREL